MNELPINPDEVEAAYQLRSESDFMLFTRGLMIPSDKGVRLFNGCIAPFQTECFGTLIPSLRAIRDGEMPQARRFWIERTKKAGKDSDLAICLLWLMAFPKRPVLVQVCAADQKQAGIIQRRASDLIHYNPWLGELVVIRRNRIAGRGGLGEVIIESTDSGGGSHGETPDLLILNELVHVARWSVMETHMNNADGVPRGVVIVSTNAGIRGTKAELWRKNALADPMRWTTRIYSERAPWVRDDDVEDARRRDPVGGEFNRLWRGKWVSGRGGAVDDAAIDKSFVLQGPLKRPEPGWQYVAGLDLGVSHDHSGVVVLGVSSSEQRIRVAWLKGWEPALPNDQGQLEVDAEDVEAECLRLWRLFKIRRFGYDPAAGGSFMAQSLRKQGVPMREVAFSSPTNCTAMATAFVTAVRGGRLECYEDAEGRLRRDFGKFQIVAKVPSGYKLEAVSDEYGHADVGTALVICLPEALRLMGGRIGFQEDDVLAGGGKAEEDELKEMPSELLDICQSGVEVGKVGGRAIIGREKPDDDDLRAIYGE